MQNVRFVTVGFSQIGRNSHATAISHVVIAHCSMPNQQIYFRNDGTLSTFDSYCLIANNSTVNVDEAGSGTINATITGNHIHGDQTAIAEALLTTSGGNEDNLYVDFTTGIAHHRARENPLPASLPLLGNQFLGRTHSHPMMISVRLSRRTEKSNGSPTDTVPRAN